MKTETFKKRIESLYTKKGRLNHAYLKPVSYLMMMVNGEKVYPFTWGTNWGKLIGQEHADKLKHVCNLLGIKLSYGNSGKGGKAKDFFYLESKEIKKIKSVDFTLINEL